MPTEYSTSTRGQELRQSLSESAPLEPERISGHSGGKQNQRSSERLQSYANGSKIQKKVLNLPSDAVKWFEKGAAILDKGNHVDPMNFLKFKDIVKDLLIMPL